MNNRETPFDMSKYEFSMKFSNVDSRLRNATIEFVNLIYESC